MKYKHFLTIVVSIVIFSCLAVGCEDDPEIRLSTHTVEFESYAPDTVVQVIVSSNVSWTIEVIYSPNDEEWLEVEPIAGFGNGIIEITAEENPDFTFRNAQIVVSGVGARTLTISIEQERDIDILPYIVNEKFREYLLEYIVPDPENNPETRVYPFDNDPQDGKISKREARKIENIDVRAREINTLEGIEHFPNLITLDCSGNLIANLDLSKNTRLQRLTCQDNFIERLDLTANSALRILRCSWNPIEQLNVTGLVNLREIEIHHSIGKRLQNIDVSTNTELQVLGISGNIITNLNLSNNPELRVLQCNDNRISSLVLQNNTKLENLVCGYNLLTSLDVSANRALKQLDFQNNTITSIVLTNNIELSNLTCSDNGMTNLNLSANVNLQRLYCERNRLSSLDLSKNTKLEYIFIKGCDPLDSSCTTGANLSGVLDLSYLDFDEEYSQYFMDFRHNNIGTIIVPHGSLTYIGNQASFIFKDASTQWVEGPER